MPEFANPRLLWLFTVFIPLIGWYVWKRKGAYPSLGVSSTSAFKGMGRPLRQYLLHFLFVLRLGAIGALIFVLCRPQTHDAWQTSRVEGTDIVLALDVSTSMLATDFRPNRMEAAKEVANKFVANREDDNMGLVVFAGESFTGVPMTNDRSMLINYINSLGTGIIEDGTAIGDGLATAINRIKDGKAKSKSIILLTDGSNNMGTVAPQTAAEIAKKLGIKVYTVGIGTNGRARFPYQNMFGRIEYVDVDVVIDETTLKKIASSTGGKYFRATNNNVLAEIFDEIDQLEKTEIDVRNFSNTEDHYEMWAFLALGLLLLEMLLRNTLLRKIP